MKKSILLSLWVGLACAVSAQGLDPILKQFVADGRVDYRGLSADPAPLKKYLEQAGEIPESEFKS